MKELLKKVINGEVESVNLPFTPIKEIERVLTELGINTSACEADTNGWEVDFWYTYERKYELSGSLHYGKFEFRNFRTHCPDPDWER
jgi:hypothetical protein